MVKAKFVSIEGWLNEVIAEATGYDWMEALDKAYTKLMKIEVRPRTHIKFEFY